MWSTARNIAAGDLVIIWQTREAVQPLVITPGKEFNGKFGTYRHSDLVGIPFGSKVGSRVGRGFIHILRPTPELWTLALPHRTQILYVADIAFIVSNLNIRPGSQVIEAGTGSGSFSHSVARTIGRSGHLYSYEFHETRANKAREEFRSHGISDIITLTHRNVCKDGFTVENQVDAVFLDLPAPWDAVQHAKKALRKDQLTRICCFSPCMEQVLRTVNALNEAGFTDIKMYETLLRPFEAHNDPVLPSIDEIGNKLKNQEARREVKRLKQIAASDARKGKILGKKRKRDELELESQSGNDRSGKEGPEQGLREGEGAANVTVSIGVVDEKEGGEEEEEEGEELIELETKRVRTDRVGEKQEQEREPEREQSVQEAAATASTLSDPDPQAERGSGVRPMKLEESHEHVFTEAALTDDLTPLDNSDEAPESPQRMVFSRVINEVRGHTSYLTFAVLLPTLLPPKNPDLFVVDEEKSAKNPEKTSIECLDTEMRQAEE